MSAPQRKWLLTQNSELRKDGIFNWTLPAFVVRLSNGKAYNACPQAGVCARTCYARSGAYLFKNVKAAHVRNLEMTLFGLESWEADMTAELSHKRYRGGHVRIHDAGDFHSDPYTAAWLRIIRATKDVTFYAYTKEVARFKRMVEPSPPQNFKWVYSYGGQQDSLIDERTDRVADIFPSYEAMAAEGYSSQDESDLQAIYNKNPRVGIPYNNIPHMKKILAGRTFREWQQSVDLFRSSKKEGADHNPNVPGRYATCLCGAPFSGKPAPGCNRFGHAVHTKNNAGEEQDLFNQQEDIKRMMEMAVQTKDGISIFDCCDQCDACLTDGEKESGKRLCGFCNEEALRANEGVG